MSKTVLTESLENLGKSIDVISKENYVKYSNHNIVSLVDYLSNDVARLTASFKVRLLHIIEVARNMTIDEETITSIDWHRVYKTIYVNILYDNGTHSTYGIYMNLLNAQDEYILENSNLVQSY